VGNWILRTITAAAAAAAVTTSAIAVAATKFAIITFKLITASHPHAQSHTYIQSHTYTHTHTHTHRHTVPAGRVQSEESLLGDVGAKWRRDD
jgi:hypothetical protein